ncbi:MAG TPA: hypothetical protein VEO91_00625 [Candidatus Limnocylindria bacterium]|nr:hypothetical protein [Candidatus Limnocylindria bacterium]
MSFAHRPATAASPIARKRLVQRVKIGPISCPTAKNTYSRPDRERLVTAAFRSALRDHPME